MSASSNIARWASNESLIHNGNLQEILCQGSSLQIIIIGLADASEKAHGSRPAKLELQHAEHEAFGLQNLIDCIASIDHVNNLINRRAVDLLIFRSDKDCSGPDQLELAQGDYLARQESINVVDTEKQCFG